MRDAFETLRVESLLEEMNRHLLDQRGEVTVYLPWDTEAQNERDDQGEDEGGG